MKLKILTLTGETFEVEVKDDATINNLQKAISKSRKVNGAVRTLKGQEMLPGDSTLVQHNILDGNTVNIVIEPEKEISIEIHNAGIGRPSFQKRISNMSTVLELKEMLAEEDDMVIPGTEYKLTTWIDGKVDAKLDDETLPLHYYGLDEGSELKIIKTVFSRQIENQKGELLRMNLSADATVGELRQRLFQLIDKCEQVDNILLFKFVSRNHGLRFSTVCSKLTDDKASMGELCKFYMIVNRFTKKLSILNSMPLVSGVEEGDTVLSVKLRAQDQLDVPVHRVRVIRASDGKECLDSDVIERENTSSSILSKKKTCNGKDGFEVVITWNFKEHIHDLSCLFG